MVDYTDDDDDEFDSEAACNHARVARNQLRRKGGIFAGIYMCIYIFVYKSDCDHVTSYISV